MSPHQPQRASVRFLKTERSHIAAAPGPPANVLRLMGLIALLTSLVANSSQTLAVAPPPPDKASGRTAVGMEGEYRFGFVGPRLEAKPFDEHAPIVVQVVDVAVGSKPGAQTNYVLHYVGLRAGRYNLRDYLVAVDGTPVDVRVEPMWVAVTEKLPVDHKGDLEELASVAPPATWPYRKLVAAAITLWTLPAAAFVVVRMLRRKKTTTPAVVETLSTEAELRALVEVALAGGLDTAKQARLEELLLRYWRESLHAGTTPTLELIARLKHDPRTAPLIAQLETWLYRRPAARDANGADRASVDVAQLLTPYRDVAHIGSAAGGRSGR